MTVLLGEGEPVRRSPRARAAAVRRALHVDWSAVEASVARAEELLGSGWPPALAGLWVGVDARGVPVPVIDRLDELGAIVVAIDGHACTDLLAEGLLETAIVVDEEERATRWVLHGPGVWFRGTRGLVPSGPGGSVVVGLAAELVDAIGLLDHLRSAPVPGDLALMPHAEPRYLARFAGAPCAPKTVAVVTGAGSRVDLPAVSQLAPELLAACLDHDAAGLAALDRALLEAGLLLATVPSAEREHGVAWWSRLARRANLPLALMRKGEEVDVAVGPRFDDARLLRHAAWLRARPPLAGNEEPS